MLVFDDDGLQNNKYALHCGTGVPIENEAHVCLGENVNDQI